MLPTTSFTEFELLTAFDAPAYDLYPLEPRVLEVCSAGRVARCDGRPLDLAPVDAALVQLRRRVRAVNKQHSLAPAVFGRAVMKTVR